MVLVNNLNFIGIHDLKYSALVSFNHVNIRDFSNSKTNQ